MPLSPDTPSSDEIEDAVAADAEAGVASFSDGTNSIVAMEPEKRLELADRQRRARAAAQPHFGMRSSQIVSPGGGF